MRRMIALLAAVLAILSCAASADTARAKTEVIADEAFMNDKSLVRVDLPETVRRIGAKAYANCTNLKEIRCASKDAAIDDTAFAGIKNAVFYCPEGSTMQKYASARGFITAGPDGIELVCDTDKNGAAGLPITWEVGGLTESAADPGSFTYTVTCAGEKSPVLTLTGTNGRTVTYTPKSGGAYTLHACYTSQSGIVLEKDSKSLSVSDKMYFGTFEQDGKSSTTDRLAWKVLEVKDGEALLITEKIIRNAGYFNPSWIKYKYTYWATSYIGTGSSVNYWNNIKSEKTKITGITPEHVPLKDKTFGTEADLYPVHARYWCNSVFYRNAFTEEEKSRILLTHNVNGDSPKYGTPGGPDSDDYVFFLSMDEVKELLPTDASRKASQTTSARAGNRNNTANYWWLRTPGWSAWSAAYVQGSTGGISSYGSDVGHDIVGYRPCIRIRTGG